MMNDIQKKAAVVFAVSVTLFVVSTLSFYDQINELFRYQHAHDVSIPMTTNYIGIFSLGAAVGSIACFLLFKKR